MSTINREQWGELLSAYLDGELDEQQAQRVERKLREDESARQLFQELQQTAELVSTLPRQTAPSSIADDLQLQLERDELLGDPAGSEPVIRKPRILLKSILSIAAMIAMVVTAGLWMVREDAHSRPGPGGDVFTLADSDQSKFKTPQPFHFDRTANENVESRSAHEISPESEEFTKRALSRHQQEIAPSNTLRLDSRFADADIHTKLQAGMDVHAIQLHPFSHETLRLRIQMRNADERDALATRLVTYFSNRRMKDLSRASYRSSIDRSIGGFFYRGRAPVNFDQSDQAQILVRIAVGEIDDFLDEVSRTRDIEDRVALASGPLVFRGLEHARTTLHSLESSDTGASLAQREETSDSKRHRYRRKHRSTKPPSSSMATDKNKDRSEMNDLFDDLFEVLGLDPEFLETMLQESSDDPTPATETDKPVANREDHTLAHEPMIISSSTQQTQTLSGSEPDTLRHGSLVRHRLRELRREDQEHKDPEHYVTFVVELRIDKTRPKPPSKTGRTPRRSPTKKPSPSKSKVH